MNKRNTSLSRSEIYYPLTPICSTTIAIQKSLCVSHCTISRMSVDKLSRVCSKVCTHKLGNLERCTICDVIIYDYGTSLNSLTFDELLIASPRHVFPSNEEIEATTARILIENEQIAKTKFRYQIDQIQLEQSSSTQNVKSAVIQFAENADPEQRSQLFQKRTEVPVPVKLRRTLTDEPKGKGEGNYINMQTDEISAPTLSTQIQIILIHEGGEVINIDIHPSVTVDDVISAIIERKPHLSNQQWCIRWIDDDGEPDFDLPPVDPETFVHSLNIAELSMCPVTRTLNDD